MDNELPASVKNLEEDICRGVATALNARANCYSEFHMQPEPGNNYRSTVFVVAGMRRPL